MSAIRTKTLERGGFTITVPESWWEFDIHPATRDNSIREIINDRVRDFPELAQYRPAITKFLRQMGRDAWNSGAVYCGCMAQGFGHLTLTASVTVSVVGARTPEGSVLPTDPKAIVGSLREKEARRETDTWRKVTTVTIPRVGQAARTYGVEDVEIPGSTKTIRVVLMQTFIQHPEIRDHVVLVSCSSPILDLADSFFDVFDAVTSTFRFLPGSQPSTTDGSGHTA